MKDLFHAYRNVDLTVDELAQASLWISRKLKLTSDDGRLGRLNQRTIRYYQGRGLLDPPDRKGRNATYLLLHLLQVLTIRCLQVEGCSLDGIKELIDSGELPWRSESSLERAIELANRTIEGPSRNSVEVMRAPAPPAAFFEDESSSRRRRSRESEADVVQDLFSAEAPSFDDQRPAIDDRLLERLERRLEEIVMRQLDQRIEDLAPRFETIVDRQVEQRLADAGEQRISREVGPGVRVIVDPSRVNDPDEVLSRIEEAISGDR